MRTHTLSVDYTKGTGEADSVPAIFTTLPFLGIVAGQVDEQLDEHRKRAERPYYDGLGRKRKG